MSLRSKLIRLAHENPALRKDLLPLLQVEAHDKVALAKETQDFVEWVINTQEPLPEARIERFLTSTLGLEIKPPIKKREGPRFIEGDRVEVRADKHKDEATIAPYVEFNGKTGVVTSTDNFDALVQLDSGSSAPVRFPLALKPRGVGLMKYTPPFVMEGSDKIEMIYFADPEAKITEEQQVTVTKYKERARGEEKRSANYYTGHIFSARTNASGQVYFQTFPQQRQRVDPSAEGGFQVRSFNPVKGKVLYMGVFGRRPSSWKKDLEKLQKESEGGER